MAKNEETVPGIVTEALPNTMFRVQLTGEPEKSSETLTEGEVHEVTEPTEVLAYLSGKMRLYRIKVLVGDKVEVVLDPYGGKARLVRRN